MPADRDSVIHRTLLEYEQNLMAWTRTSVSFMTLGFGFYKFFDYLVEADQNPLSNSFFGPPEFALVIIGIAIAAVTLAILHFINNVRLLEKECAAAFRSAARPIANFVLLLGWALLIVVLL